MEIYELLGQKRQSGKYFDYKEDEENPDATMRFRRNKIQFLCKWTARSPPLEKNQKWTATVAEPKIRENTEAVSGQVREKLQRQVQERNFIRSKTKSDKVFI